MESGQKRRDRLFIIAEILKLARDGSLKTQIMYRATLSFAQLNEYLSFLIRIDLLRLHNEKKKKVYKTTAKGELLQIACQLKALCAEHNALFIMNDHPDLAVASGADGLHLGQEDLPVEEARKLMPIDMILGVSVHTVEQAKAAEGGGADYIAVGSMYPTRSKEKAVVVGPERLREVRGAVSVPLVAIGGIDKDNAGEVAAAGADGVAVISAILGAEDVVGAAREIIKAFEAEK